MKTPCKYSAVSHRGTTLSSSFALIVSPCDRRTLRTIQQLPRMIQRYGSQISPTQHPRQFANAGIVHNRTNVRLCPPALDLLRHSQMTATPRCME